MTQVLVSKPSFLKRSALACASGLTLGLACLISAMPAFAARDTLVLGMSVEPQGLDPTIAAPVAIGQVTWQNIFEGLVSINEKGEVKPLLAKSYEISADGLTYIFHLQSGVHFHNGEAFNANVAKFSLERARGAESVNPQKRFFSAIDTIEAKDDTTLVLHLKQKNSSLLYWLGWPAAVMVEPKSANDNKTNPIGTGPFKFASWAKGDKVELVANGDYWNKAVHVALKTVDFRFIADAQAQASALKAGDVDAFPEFGAPELVDDLKNDPKLTTAIGNTEFKVVAGMNNSRKPFNDKRVRQALMMAIDRKMLIDGAWNGLGTPIGSHYTPNDRGFVDLTGALPFNPQKARALLAEAGYPNGFTFTIKTPQMPYAPRSAEIMQAMFAEIGVKMEIEPTEFPAKWVADIFKSGDYDMTIVAHAEPMDIDIYARDNYYFHYKNPEFNTVLQRIESATDKAEIDKLYGVAQKILADDVPALYLFVMPKLGVWNAKLSGLWVDEPIPANVLANVKWEE